MSCVTKTPSGVIAVKRPAYVAESPINISMIGLYPVCFAIGIEIAATNTSAGTQPGPTAEITYPVKYIKIGINQTNLPSFPTTLFIKFSSAPLF